MSRIRSIVRLCLPGRRRLNPVLAALGSLLLFGCAVESQLTEQAPDFTAERLRAGGLAVLGVVQVEEVAQVRPPLVAALERVLAAARSDIPLVPAGRALEAVSDSVQRLFLLGYQMRGDPDEALFVTVAKTALASARYGILARVESAPIRYGSRQVMTGLPGEERREGQVRVTGRDAHVSVSVYDLTTRALVFGAKYVGSSDEAPNFRPTGEDSLAPPPLPRTRVDPRARAGTIPGPGEDPSRLGFPEAPPVARAAEASFLLMARDLPGAPVAPGAEKK